MVLVVAIVLLLLAGLLTLFAVNVGIFEQRSTGNDLRNKMVIEVAEAGLAQGFEYLYRQHKGMLKDPSQWERCAADDVSFPCGAISAAVFDDDGDPATAPVPRRSQMFRLKAPTVANVIPGIDAALSRYMLPLPATSKIATLANAFAVAYGVAPVMCFASRPAHPNPGGIPCNAGVGTGSTSVAITTFVSVAKMAGENASSTLVQTVGQYPKFGDDLLNRPPITTSGTAGVTGTLQIVTNPNAGGTGVPVSVWSRVDVDKTGTTNSCFADEFFRYTQGSHTPSVYQSTIRCDDCRCDSNDAPKTLSYDASGRNRCLTATADCEGMDILDVDAGTDSQTGYNTAGHEGANYNVRSDALSFPTCEFPPDLFDFVFHVPTWEDTDEDCFAETKRAPVPYANPEVPSATAMVGPDEAYLYRIADKVIPKPANLPLLKASQLGTRALLTSAASSGVIWCQQVQAGDCDIAAGDQVGTPDAPVVLILDGPVRIQGVVFGFVYIRDTGNTLDPATGSSVAGACPSNCMLQMNAGAAIYGAVVLQGQMTSNGTSAVIYDGNVLRGILEHTDPVYATLPGAWTDQRSY
jgi:hypothetical protein